MTTKTQAPVKTLTRGEAIGQVQTIISRLVLAELDFTLMHDGKKQQFRIFGVTHCDSIKVICPEFTIEFDERMKRYARMVINYEQ